jgi:LPXTG-motif cell wall-anchored protein
MKQRLSAILGLCAFVAVAAVGIAQNADANTAAPTKNDLRLRLTEPAEGATVTGTSVRVTVDYNRQIFGAGQGTHFGEANFPHAIFDVYLDNKLQQSLKSGESNVATIDSVPSGSHKIAVVAKNISGEIIDRKEVKFVTVPSTTASTSSAPAPAPVAETSRETTTSTAPARSYEPPATTSAPAAPATLPQTGSAAPRMALVGLALAGVGLLVARKTR